MVQGGTGGGHGMGHLGEPRSQTQGMLHSDPSTRFAGRRTVSRVVPTALTSLRTSSQGRVSTTVRTTS